MLVVTLFALWCHFGIARLTTASDISEYITHYEPVWIISVVYPQVTDDSQPTLIEFYSFRRLFTLSVTYGRSGVVTSDAQIEVHGEENETIVKVPARSFLSRMIEGSVLEDPSSEVQGTFYDGVLDVVIKTDDTTYYIEPAAKYFNKKTYFTSIMYRSRDVDIGNLLCLSSVPGKKCDTYRKSYVLGPFVNESVPIRRDFKTKAMKLKHVMASKSEEAVKHHEDPPVISKAKKVCLLKLVADHLYYQTVGRRNLRTATEEMVKLLQEASYIFGNTSFPIRGKNVSGVVSLQVKNIFIHKSANEPNYKLYDENLSAEAFLEKLAEYSFDSYCLGLGFTFRSFKKRVLGLAYLADPTSSGTLGGICQQRKYIPFRERSVSYNAAFVTVGSHDRALPKTVSVLSLTHELGHSFGAHHDPSESKVCSPGVRGAFLMSSNAVTGMHSNNLKFSPCSRKEIGLVLENKDKTSCFEPVQPVCGNGIAEDFEECDCGHKFQCSETDACCTPMGGVGKDAECTYRRQDGKRCSPEKDRCCTSDCQVVTAKEQKLCADLESCTEESFCDGVSAQCPKSPHKNDLEPCRERTGLCQNGVCLLDVCTMKQKMRACACREPEFKCLKCCSTNESSCRPAHELGILSSSGLSVVRPKGQSCEGGTNKICNTLGDCVDPFIGLRDSYGAESTTKKPEVVPKTWDTLTIVLVVLISSLLFTVCVCLGIWLMPFRNPQRAAEQCDSKEVCEIRL